METNTKSKHTPGPCGDRHEIDRAYSEAHERIRNAAPDLLAACERFIGELGDKFAHLDGECTCSAAGSDPDCPRHGAVDFMRAAISKARFG